MIKNCLIFLGKMYQQYIIHYDFSQLCKYLRSHYDSNNTLKVTYNIYNCMKRTDIVIGDIIVIGSPLFQDKLTIARVINIPTIRNLTTKNEWKAIVLHDERVRNRSRGSIITVDSAVIAKALFFGQQCGNNIYHNDQLIMKHKNCKNIIYNANTNEPLETMVHDQFLNYIYGILTNKNIYQLQNATFCKECEKAKSVLGNYVKCSSIYDMQYTLQKYSEQYNQKVLHSLIHINITYNDIGVIDINGKLLLNNIDYKTQKLNIQQSEKLLCQDVHCVIDNEKAQEIIYESFKTHLECFNEKLIVTLNNFKQVTSYYPHRTAFKTQYLILYPKKSRFHFNNKDHDVNFLWAEWKKYNTQST